MRPSGLVLHADVEADQKPAVEKEEQKEPERVLRPVCVCFISVVEEAKDRERWRLLSFLRCISWSRRSRRKGHEAKDANNVHEDDRQDPEEEVALTSLSPNGNCEEAAGRTGT
ncbi:hypothetical protein llap_15540 [Limosa lapponica baueri]|uniref:C2orf72-like C-terminal domain-containing protein n=1 Tax=Limosa lapponica baueri TaxID=1758121 RepID=A0A2I0TK27_LIMLA|nr:hypothetical protein llap_15540 [Limosa lapponica baueri]